MNDETFEQLEGATTASEAWTILSTNYKGDDMIKRVRLQTLRRQYKLLQMETIETIDVYINKVLALTNQMKTNGETHSEQAKVEKILRSLTPRFEHVIAAIEEANEISKMTVRLLSDPYEHMSSEWMTIILKNQLNWLYKHKPQLVAPIINMVLIVVKVVVARIMEALSKTTLVPITIQVQITLGAGNVIAEDDKTFIINQILSVIIAINATIMQMSAYQKVIIMLSIVLKKIVITNKMKMIIRY